MKLLVILLLLALETRVEIAVEPVVRKCALPSA
jgi:hypothetical protein